MNRTAIVKHKQSIYDIAIQYCGDVSAANDIAEMNDLCPDEDIAADTVLQLPSVINVSVVNKLNLNGIEPATANIAELSNSGINYWSIGSDFIVQ